MRDAITLGLGGLAAWFGLLAGCASPNKSEAPEPAPALTMPAVDHDAWRALGYSLDWRGTLGLAGLVDRELRQISVAPDTIVTLDSEGFASLLDSKTGSVRWSSEVGSRLTKFVGVARPAGDAARVLVCTQGEVLGLATGTGSLVSRERLGHVVNTAPAIADGLLVFGCSDKRVLAHRPGGVDSAWGFVARGEFEGDPVVVGAAIGVVSQAGDVLFLYPDGTLAGHNRVYGPLATNPVTDGRRLIVAGTDQSVWAFEPSGVLAWRHRTSSALRVQPACLPDERGSHSVYVQTGEGEGALGLTALDAGSGVVRWTAKGVGGTVVLLRGDTLLVHDAGAQRAVTLLASTGDVVDKADLPGISRLIEGEDGSLYAVGPHTVISKFRPRR